MKKTAALTSATITGCALLVGGVYLIHAPAAVILAGLLVLAAVGGYVRGD